MNTAARFLAAWAVALSAVPEAVAQIGSIESQIVGPRQGTLRFCELPSRRRIAPPVLPSAAVSFASETEPNNDAVAANLIALGLGEAGGVDVSGARNGFGDQDFFALDLLPGDVLGAEVVTGSTLTLRDPATNILVRSQQDASFIYPDASPLPGDGVQSSRALAWVIATAGRYTIAVSGPASTYTLRLRRFRPPLENAAPGAHQIIFLDFNGASGINAQALFGGGNANANLSGLASFLPGWGLSAGNQSAVIDAIVAGVNDGLSDLFGANNPAFDFEIRNSRDNADPFGQANVSRVIIGGTIDELGIATIGIAESIDPGNFDTTETAVVLLDLLSAGAGDPNSLNSIPRAGGIIPLIGKAVGNVAVHELGHYSANFHTENSTSSSNNVRSIMDAGGASLAINIAGVGPDGTFGTADDQDVDLAIDAFESQEGFIGDEDTTNFTAFGLTSPGGPTPTPPGPTPVPTSTPTRTPTVPIPTCNGLPATIVGTENGETLTGTSGPDVIVGLGGNDSIRGGGGNDTLCGNEGNDSMIGGIGTDFCDGGTGANTFQSCESSGPAPTPTRTPTSGPSPTPTPTLAVPTCNGLAATIVGTSGNDTLLGTTGPDVIVGLGGNDDLRGGAGNDTICGNDGDDTLSGGFGTDFCDGGPGTNTSSGCEGP